MANYVKISSVAPRPPVIDENTAPQQLVEKMINFWRDKFSQVLPEKPDLIVVPECCDRPLDWPRKKVLEYYHIRGNQIRD